jgi:hypothetical protein
VRLSVLFGVAAATEPESVGDAEGEAEGVIAENDGSAADGASAVQQHLRLSAGRLIRPQPQFCVHIFRFWRRCNVEVSTIFCEFFVSSPAPQGLSFDLQQPHSSPTRSRKCREEKNLRGTIMRRFGAGLSIGQEFSRTAVRFCQNRASV